MFYNKITITENRFLKGSVVENKKLKKLKVSRLHCDFQAIFIIVPNSCLASIYLHIVWNFHLPITIEKIVVFYGCEICDLD